MLSKRVLTELIGSVYDAAGDAARWESFLGRLAHESCANSAALVMHHLGRELHTISASWRMDPEASHLYQQYYGAVDVWAKRGRSKPAGHICTSESLCRSRELAATEIYNDFLLRFGIIHGMFGLVENNASRWASLSLYRDGSSTEFNVSDLETLDLLIPHIQRAFKLHFQFAELKAKTEGFETALDMMTTGVMFLNANAEVILMNKQAEDLRRAKDGLLVVQRRVCARVEAESARLRGIIIGAVQTANDKGLSAGGTLLVSRSLGRPLSITVAPLRNVEIGIPVQPCAILFVYDPDQTVQLPTDLLQTCYGLTTAEARLTMLLLEGNLLKEAADLCGVTQNTAKSQLKSVFAKTGVKRQSELVRLFLNGLRHAI